MLQPLSQPFNATFTPPGSKSLTNRALVLAALAQGESHLANALIADDTALMIQCLTTLGFQIEVAGESIRVRGAGGQIPARSAELFCGNSGTTIRFLTALCALGKGEYLLDGVERMRQRPIGQLVTMLGHIGARIEYLMQEGFPPLRVIAESLPGGLLRFGPAQSSQFLSAVLMIGPYTCHELRVELIGKQTSWPYVAMTMQLMDHFNVTPELIRDPVTHEPEMIIVPPAVYRASDYRIEPDASSAGYFLAAAAIHPGAKITIEGLGKTSLQGDVGLAHVLRQMGADLVFGKDSITITGPDALRAVDVDLSEMPDMAQTLAAVALFAKGTTTLRGLATLRLKETDRLTALCNELSKVGATVKVQGDEMLQIDPPRRVAPATIETYDDHRMAMSFAVVGTKCAGITIRNVECVSKTYPGFFADLTSVTRSGPGM